MSAEWIASLARTRLVVHFEDLPANFDSEGSGLERPIGGTYRKTLCNGRLQEPTLLTRASDSS